MTEFLDISVYNGNCVFFSEVARKLGKFVLDVVGFRTRIRLR